MCIGRFEKIILKTEDSFIAFMALYRRIVERETIHFARRESGTEVAKKYSKSGRESEVSKCIAQHEESNVMGLCTVHTFPVKVLGQ